jgi:hypothetical protein
MTISTLLASLLAGVTLLAQPQAERNGQPFTGLETKITFRDIR